MDTANALLHIQAIEVCYQNAVVALHDVNLTVRPGEIHAVLGANGAGKSTTLKAVSNLLPAERGQVTGGHITFDGHDVTRTNPATLVRHGLVQVLEGRHCFPNLTVGRKPHHRGFGARCFTRRDRHRSGKGLCDFSASASAPPQPGRFDFGRRTANGRHWSGADVAPAFAGVG